MSAFSILLGESPYLKILLLRRRRRRRKTRRPTDKFCLERGIDGEFNRLYEKLRNCPHLFYGYTRMLPETFDYVLNAIKYEFKYTATNFQQPISLKERLIVTLR